MSVPGKTAPAPPDWQIPAAAPVEAVVAPVSEQGANP